MKKLLNILCMLRKITLLAAKSQIGNLSATALHNWSHVIDVPSIGELSIAVCTPVLK
jgi:hypothetical protein